MARPALRRTSGACDPQVRRRRLAVRSGAGALPRRLCRLRPPRGCAVGAARRQPVGAGAVPRPDPRLQGFCSPTARPVVCPCPRRARRARDDRRRHLRRHRIGCDRGIRRPRPDQNRHPAPARPHQRGAAPADDHGSGRQRRQPCDRRHVRRLPGPGEGDVRRRAVPPRPAPLGGQLDQLGAGRGAGAVLRLCGARARRARPGGGVRRANREFWKCAGRLGGAAHGAADRQACGRVEPQRHSFPFSGRQRHERARRGTQPLAEHGHPGFFQFRTVAVRAFAA